MNIWKLANFQFMYAVYSLSNIHLCLWFNYPDSSKMSFSSSQALSLEKNIYDSLSYSYFVAVPIIIVCILIIYHIN